MKTKMRCGVILRHGFNENGVLIIDLLNAGGSITCTVHGELHYPSEAQLVIDRKNIPILKELIDSYIKRVKRGKR